MTLLQWHWFVAALCVLLVCTARARNWPWVWHKELRRDPDADGSPGAVYMDRWQLLKLPFFSLYVNRINLPDYDELLHNHPWRRAYSLKLGRGEYIEQLPWPADMLEKWPWLARSPLRPGRRPKRWSRIPEKHRIVYLKDGRPVWTLFIGLGFKRPWGFVADDGTIIPKDVRKKQRGSS